MADDASPLTDPSLTIRPHRFTWDEVVRLSAADVFGPTTRVELIGGELYPMPEEGFLHVDAVHALQTWLLQALGPAGLMVRIREPVHLPDGSVLIPDLSVFPSGTAARSMTAARALLVVEVSDTTLVRDVTLKLPRYAAAEVAEVWLVEAPVRAVRAHRQPRDGAFSSVVRVLPGEGLAPLCAPQAGFDPDALPRPG